MLKTKSLFHLVISITFLLVLSGCVNQGITRENSKPTATKNTPKWSAILSVSGGLAGLMQNVSIDSEGIVIINDLKLNKSFRKKLDNNELKTFTGLILKNKQSKSINSLSRRCRDCFTYKLLIRWHKKQQLAVLDDINLRESSYNKIILFLRGIVKKYRS